GWFLKNSGGRSHPVGELTANPIGLLDIHGNVFEWVQDWHGIAYYRQFQDKTAVDPQGPTAGTHHMFRGWAPNNGFCRSAMRNWFPLHHRASYVGIRAALTVDAVKTTIARRNSKQTLASGAWLGWPKDAPAPAIAPFDAKQARKHQEEWAEHLGVSIDYENSIGMKFVLIPPGEFMMGSTPEQIEEARKLTGEDKVWHEFFQSEG